MLTRTRSSTSPSRDTPIRFQPLPAQQPSDHHPTLTPETTRTPPIILIHHKHEAQPHHRHHLHHLLRGVRLANPQPCSSQLADWHSRPCAGLWKQVLWFWLFPGDVRWIQEGVKRGARSDGKEGGGQVRRARGRRVLEECRRTSGKNDEQMSCRRKREG